jgi:ParB family chromosome partitioning protein
MAARKSGLGRGLDALIPVDRPEHGFAQIPLERIRPNPHQPRAQFADDALAELAASIREVGVLQPVVVRPDEEEGRYVLIAGERRWRAAQQAGLAEIPAMIRDEREASTNVTEALIENVQREDLSPLEEAAAYRQLMDEFSMTHEQIAVAVSRSRSAVTNTLRLLQLPAAVQGLLERGAISAGHARALLGLDDEAYAVHVAEQAASEGWSVRQVEEAVRARREEPAPARPRRSAAPRPAAIIALEERLADRLGARVKIDYSERGGKLTVRFADLDDLERIYRTFFG